ncbi:hypothetical protein [Butyrivibrio sp. VCB2006]|uniref:hypothetical protein n=1 Tax=Butyrivibrio sp. VCB2006 TaxID=1280679 RepID=UPI0003FAE6C4|nr:hypothetical protein [Butyrivibrio sp. VCB2006]
MSKDYEYLSDKELESLIASVEAEGPIKAPEDFEDTVMSNIVDIEKLRKLKAVKGSRPDNRNVLDYSIYCLKVFGSIAAAILIMVMVPFVKDGENPPNREEVLAETYVAPREEVISSGNVKSRDEALYEAGNSKIKTNIESIKKSILGRLNYETY